jgi:DNA-directed RNA polymerase specialized sigma24 family protein
MVAPGTPHPHAARIASPAVREKIAAVTGHRVPPADRGDIAQQAYVRLLLWKELPATDDELLGLVVCIVRGLLTDFYRRRAVNERRTAGDADVDQVPFDAQTDGVAVRDEWRRAIEFVEAEVAAGRVDAAALRWARRLADGDTLAQIAADEDIPVPTLKSRIHRVRKHLRKQWPKYAAGIAGVVVLFLLLRREEPDGVTHANPHTGRDEAAQYRDEAAHECREHDYAACARDLDRARARDPAGEALPDVKVMRDAIDRAMRDGAVPR